MKIINITKDEENIKITTNEISDIYPYFVYKKDKFKTLEALEAEINKKIALDLKRTTKKTENTIISQFAKRNK